MSTPVTTAHEFVGDPRDACTDCDFSVYHSNHNTKTEGKSEACSKGHHGVCIDKACICAHHQIRDAAIHRTETPAEQCPKCGWVNDGIINCNCKGAAPKRVWIKKDYDDRGIETYYTSDTPDPGLEDQL